MQTLTISEFERVPRSEIHPVVLRDLHRLDERNAEREGKLVFDWSRRATVCARNWVGVLQAPGLSVEILPKIEGTSADTARRNLLHMLSATGRIPVQSRELAALHPETMPVHEVLIRVFADRLIAELRRGICRSYVAQQENARFVRGRIQMGEHLRRNLLSAERVFVEYDELVPDTHMNRVIKRAATLLARATGSNQSRRQLREALVRMEGVMDEQSRLQHLEDVHFSRANQRFRPLFDLAALILGGSSPSQSAGDRPSFSLLFPMERIFEEYIASQLRRIGNTAGFEASQFHAQARGRRRWLLRGHDGHGRFRLIPDIVIDSPDGGAPRLILDTKWKRLLPDTEDSRNGVAPGDIYQLYAYSRQYGCANNVLLFPEVPGVTRKQYRVDGSEPEAVIRIETIDIGRDLQKEGKAFRDELTHIVGPATPTGADTT